MAKSPVSRASRAKNPEEEITAEFLLGWKRRDANEFSMELARGAGLKFLRDRIDPYDQEEFVAAFDELVSLGCVPKTLASTLYCFCKSYLRTGWSPTIPPYADALSFPCKGVRRGHEKTLRKAAEIVQRMDIVPLAEQAGRALPEFRTGYVAQLLHHYADLLSAYPPRKDIVRSYAWALPCLYSKVATKKFQFSLVAQLLHAFGYRPALNRQHRKRDRERGGYDPPDQSLERNLRNFINQHPVACERLQTDLAHDDENEEMRRQEEFDRFAEKDLPMGLLAEFNPFDLRALFGIGARRTIEAQRGNTQTKKLEPPQKFDPGQERKPRRRLEI